MQDLITATFFSIMAAGFLVGVVVGLTGMGGGALMTPALIFLGVGDAATVVTADLTAAAVYKSGGAIVHKREGSPNMQLAKWLILGSVPMALLGPLPGLVVHRPRGPRRHAQALHRLRAALRRGDVCASALPQPVRRSRGDHSPADEDPDGPAASDAPGRGAGRPAGRHHQRGLGLGDHDRPADALPRPRRGSAGGHRPGAGRAAGAGRRVSNIALHGLDWSILVPLVIGSVPGTLIGSKIAPRVPQSIIRRGIVIVLTMSGVALLDKAGWAPLGAGDDETHPELVAIVGVVLVVVIPLVWGLLRRQQGRPFFLSAGPRGWRSPIPRKTADSGEDFRRSAACGRRTGSCILDGETSCRCW